MLSKRISLFSQKKYQESVQVETFEDQTIAIKYKKMKLIVSPFFDIMVKKKTSINALISYCKQ